MPPFNQDFSLGFSSSLVETLMVSRSKVDAFIEAQKAIIDSEVSAHNKRVSQEQALIDQQATNLVALRLERGLHDADTNTESLVHRKTDLITQQNRLKEQIITLKQKRAMQQKDLKGVIPLCTSFTFSLPRATTPSPLIFSTDLKKKEAEHQSRAAEARHMKAKVEESKKTTVEDLTRGIVNYKYLGLDFEKAEGNRLRCVLISLFKIRVKNRESWRAHSSRCSQYNNSSFTFTQLDAGEPSRPFSFQLNVNEEEVYEVDNCQPGIPSFALTKMTDDLNETDNLSAFVRDMSKRQKMFAIETMLITSNVSCQTSLPLTGNAFSTTV